MPDQTETPRRTVGASDILRVVTPGRTAALATGVGLFAWPMHLALQFNLDAAGRAALVVGAAAGVILARRMSGVPAKAAAAGFAAWCLCQPVLCGFPSVLFGVLPIAAVSAVAGLLCLAPGLASGLRLSGGGRAAVLTASVGTILAWAAAAVVPLWFLTAVTVLLAGWAAARTGTASEELATPPAEDSTPALASLAMFGGSALLLGAIIREACVWTMTSPVTVAGVAVGLTVALLVRQAVTAAAILMIGGGLLSAGYETLVESAVRITATWSSVGPLATVRVAAVALATFVPASALFATGRLGRVDARAALAAGTVLASLFGLVSLPFAAMAACVAALPTVFCLFPAATPSRRLSFAAAAIVGTAAAGYGVTTDTAALTGKSLFAPDAFAAIRTGRSFDMALASDEGRLTRVVQTPDGPISVWNYGGVRLELRDAGVRDGSVTMNPAASPRTAGDALTTVLAMTLHPRAESVLLVGDPAGETTLTALEYPVRSVTLAETAERTAVLQSMTAGRTNVWSDGRLKTIDCPPVRCLETTIESADVVLCRPFSSASLATASAYRPAFFAAAHARTNPGGVFCQRVNIADVDATALLSIAESVRGAFGTAAVFVTGPGEMAVVARRDADLEFDDRTLARLRKPHAVRVLSEAGCDWSVVADMTAYAPDALRDAIAAAATVPSERLPVTGIYTLMSWQPKGRTFAALAGGYASRPVQWLENVASRQEVTARIDDTKERFRIQSRHPDQFWAYRKPLRKRLQERPREVIRQVRFEEPKKVLHPDDERRKDYFLALDAAVENRDGSVLSRFATPFDPLITPFVHAEAARVFGAADDAESQLRSLTAAVYGSGDRLSARPLNDAIRLVLDGAGGPPAERYDLLQGFLEQLRRRWPARMSADGRVLLAAADLRDSVSLAKRALSEVPDWVADDASRRSDWRRRAAVIEADLVQTLRTYEHDREQALLRAEVSRAAAEARGETR